jgi:flagellar hook protein FlgE
MDVIGNNIANVNTYGYKASRATFADIYYQNLSRGSGPAATTGGTNPTQIGYGASIATIDVLNTQSGLQSTDRAMDVAITGEGFLVTQDPMGNLMYTRLGNLGFDADGNLVDGTGMYVMGFPQNADGSPQIGPDGTVEETELRPIQVAPEMLDKLTAISIGTGGEIIGVLPGNTTITIGAGLVNPVTKADFMGAPVIPGESNLQGNVTLSVGGLPTASELEQIFAKANAGGAATHPYGGSGAIERVNFGEVSIDEKVPMTITNVAGKLTLECEYVGSDGKNVKVKTSAVVENGQVVFRASGKDIMSLDLASDAVVADTADFASDTFDLTRRYEITTSDKGGNVVQTPRDVDVDGTPRDITEQPDALEFPTAAADGGTNAATWELPIGEDGTIILGADPGNFNGVIGRILMSEGEKVNIGCIALAKFANPAGLEQAGTTHFIKGQNSGEFSYAKPNSNSLGGLKANYLEMSNVDVSKEFTDMITTQRGFQANTRIVTVSDEMLNELVNLKR